MFPLNLCYLCQCSTHIINCANRQLVGDDIPAIPVTLRLTVMMVDFGCNDITPQGITDWLHISFPPRKHALEGHAIIIQIKDNTKLQCFNTPPGILMNWNIVIETSCDISPNSLGSTGSTESPSHASTTGLYDSTVEIQMNDSTTEAGSHASTTESGLHVSITERGASTKESELHVSNTDRDASTKESELHVSNTERGASTKESELHVSNTDRGASVTNWGEVNAGCIPTLHTKNNKHTPVMV